MAFMMGLWISKVGILTCISSKVWNFVMLILKILLIWYYTLYSVIIEAMNLHWSLNWCAQFPLRKRQSVERYQIIKTSPATTVFQPVKKMFWSSVFKPIGNTLIKDRDFVIIFWCWFDKVMKPIEELNRFLFLSFNFSRVYKSKQSTIWVFTVGSISKQSIY